MNESHASSEENLDQSWANARSNLHSSHLYIQPSNRNLAPSAFKTVGEVADGIASQQNLRLEAVQQLQLKKDLELKSNWDGDV